MEIYETDPENYRQLFPSPYHCYNSVNFNLLNEERCEKLLFLVFRDSKNRLGLIAGLKNNELHSPYSAPFGGFTFVKDNVTLSQLEASVDALKVYVKENGYAAVHYIMPPLFYNKLFNSKLLNIFYRKSFFMTAVDLNYEFNLQEMDRNYESNIWYNAKKNLKIAAKQNFSCFRCDTPEQVLMAYNVIKENRERKQYPLKMTLQQVQKTAEIIEADFFILQKELSNVAAAQVFKVAPGIVQIIYWGDIPDFASDKPMNFLAYYLFTQYQNLGIKYIDIGPSTEFSQPNYGLCEFKESIGCTISPKYSFKYSVN